MNHVNIKGFDVIEARSKFDEAPALAAQANEQAIGGHKDWAFPDTMTLLALQKIAPVDCWVWSASPYVGYSYSAWFVDFYDGYVNYNGRLDYYHVRLVRASQLLALGTLAHRASLAEAGIVLGARELVGLTDDEVQDLFGRFTGMTGKGWRDLYRMAEAKLKEKNT